MKRFVVLLATAMMVITFYVVQYEEYTWSPCKDGFCYSIACPPGGCATKAERIICAEMACVEEIVNKNGTDHLIGIWKVEWITGMESSHTIKKLGVVQAYKIAE